ncbi:MAG TPA: hypothetical protein VHM19_15115 [Polyangiales bacterium]|jgi:Ca2+-binding EF-hand superfamily protein|nr:hypothetical protein [Polyangiales bacterium]
MKKALGIALFVSLAGGSVAFAHGFGPGFEKLDANHDGKVSKAELGAEMKEHFAQADANHDGKVTQAEMKASFEAMREKWRAEHGDQGDKGKGEHHGRHPHGARMFDRLDTNEDGAIDQTELQNAADERFDRLDKNHDGALDKSELEHGPFGRHGDCGHEHGKNV